MNTVVVQHDDDLIFPGDLAFNLRCHDTITVNATMGGSVTIPTHCNNFVHSLLIRGLPLVTLCDLENTVSSPHYLFPGIYFERNQLSSSFLSDQTTCVYTLSCYTLSASLFVGQLTK